DRLRHLFEEAIDVVGRDWRAFPLWELYFNFEERHRQWKRLGVLIRRAMAIPMEGLSAVRVRLRALVVGDSCPPLEELCCETEVQALEEKGDASIEASCHEEAAVAPVIPTENSEAEAGPKLEKELEEGEVDDSDDELAEETAKAEHGAGARCKVQLVLKHPAEKTSHQPEPALKPKDERAERARRFLEMREDIWSGAASEVAMLQEYEAPLHRQYFHNKPLGIAQLDAWRHYLDFEESRQPRQWRRLYSLFERCLVVTNNYLEFWLRYASLLEEAEVMTGNQPELACSLLQGACLSGRLARRADALAAWAELEEQCGRAARARLLLDAGLSSCGRGSTELALRRAALESRHHDCTKAVELLQQLAGQASSTASRAILSRRLARLCED
ncbi:unnamed protein product, partial [Effrenium voratum]